MKKAFYLKIIDIDVYSNMNKDEKSVFCTLLASSNNVPSFYYYFNMFSCILTFVSVVTPNHFI